MGFQQGLSGLNASAKALDTIGNNVANSGTVGFKNSVTQFGDVFAASLSGAGTAPIGLGTKVAAISQQFTQGNITVTNNALDTAINGGGFFQVSDASNTVSYTRNGQFQLDKDGFIINAQGMRLNGITANAAGAIAAGSPIGPLRLFDPTQSLTGAPQATGTSAAGTGVQANVNLDSRQPIIPTTTLFNFADPTTYNQTTSSTIYDSLGNAHTYSLYFKKTAVNTWQVYSTVSNPAGATPTFTDLSAGGTAVQQTLNFSTTGTLTGYTPTAQAITAAQLGYPAGVAAMSFNTDFTGSTQYGSNFAVNSIAQDGFASGSLSGFSIGTDGILLGKFTNGQSQTIGQVQLAIFRNPQGLQPIGNNLWAVTPDSGPAISSAPGSTGQFGVLQSAALEDSNVDLTAELVSMITQQRAYQANAQTIKTQDSILQTLVNLR